MRASAAEVDACEQALMETDDEATQMRYAAALADYADAGGYDLEVTWDVCTIKGAGRALRPRQVPPPHDPVRR